MQECADALAPHVDWQLESVLSGGIEALNQVDVVQPVLFSIMVALADEWRAAGVEPAAVIGHSQGEIAAAVVAGGLSLSDGALVVARRSIAIRQLSGAGGMLSVALGVDEVRAQIAISAWSDQISVAVENGPQQVVLSGDIDALNGIVEQFGEEIRTQFVPVDYASHSKAVEAIRDELLELLAPIEPRACSVPFYSTVNGSLIDTTELDADYWYQNLRRTVRFNEAIGSVLEDELDVLIEISPHPVLAAGMHEIVDHRMPSAVVLGTLRRDYGGARQFAESNRSVICRVTRFRLNLIGCCLAVSVAISMLPGSTVIVIHCWQRALKFRRPTDLCSPGVFHWQSTPGY